jgi:hypothetical protein
MRIARVLWAGGCLVALLTVIGCGGTEMAKVHGTVKVNGQPVTAGAIRFHPNDGKSKTTGGEIKDGQYSVEVPVGWMKVSISEPKGTGKKKKLYPKEGSPEIEQKTEGLPPRYSDINKSTLELEVKPGDNSKDWDLKDLRK